MTRQETSVEPSLSEGEEDPSEEELIEENNDGNVCNEETSEEEAASEEDNWKEESNEDDEPHEEYADYEEESNEKDPDEEIEEEPCEEVTKPHSSLDCNLDDNLLSEAAANSGSGKKRRSTDKLETSSEKRMKRDEDSKKEENTGSSGKRRRSGWDVKEGFDEETTKFAKKRKKTRWVTDDSKLKVLGPLQLPDFADDTVLENLRDPEFQNLSSELLRINQKLKERELVDDRPENRRSPSPPPIYNDLGIRENTREVRLRIKLEARRQRIITELIKKNPSFKHLSYYKPQKLCKKLYIPHKKYPGFNFIGLIVGPGGQTIQRMERQTGAKIIIRGKGYNMKRRDTKKGSCMPWEDDEVYVQIDADNQQSLDAAVKMVEKLLMPAREETLKIKSVQLRQLAELNGTQKKKKSHKVDLVFRELCDVCGDSNHSTAYCPLTASTSGTETSTDQTNFLGDSVENPYELEDKISGESCNVCGDPSHFTVSCPLTASGPGFGIRYPIGDASFPPFSHLLHCNSAFPVIDDLEKGICASPGNYNGMPVKEIDEAKLFVGYLPRSVNTDKLIELFLPFGGISDARVIMDKNTGLSRGYGFVKYADPICAAKAVAQMNGYRIEGKVLAVRIAHLPPTTVKSHLELGGPALPVAEAVVQGNPSLVDWPGPPRTMYFSSFAKTTLPLSTPKSHLCPGRPGFPVPEAVSQGKRASLEWPGPPGSMLPQPFIPFTDSVVSFSPSRQILASPTFVPGSISSQNELEQFPGYLKSFDSPAHMHYSSSSDASSQFRSARSSGWNQNFFNLTPP